MPLGTKAKGIAKAPKGRHKPARGIAPGMEEGVLSPERATQNIGRLFPSESFIEANPMFPAKTAELILKGNFQMMLFL